MSTTRAWRRRNLLTRRCGFVCQSCGRVAIVARRRCLCGAVRGALGPLPPAGVADAVTRAGTSFESLDQLQSRRVAVVLRMADSRLACLLSEADAAFYGRLRGHRLRIAVRAIGLQSAERNEPLQYGLKAATDLRTRRILLDSNATSREAQDDRQSREKRN